jgi:hypothetical protein
LEQQEEGGYKSESTAWSDDPNNWYPTNPHHYYFDITFNKFGIFVGCFEGKLHFLYKSTEEEETEYTLTVFKLYKDKYLTKNRHAWYWRY